MADKHVQFGSSTARRTLNCAAWTNIETPPQGPAGADADRGNRLHDIMEAHFDRDEDLGVLCKDLDTDDRNAIDYAVNATESVLDAYNIDGFACEIFMGDPDNENVGGTPDLVGMSETGNVCMNLDYKFGRVPVDYWEQHLFGFMMLRMNDEYADMIASAERLVAVIIQPAVSAAPIVQEFTIEDLDAFERDYYNAIDLAATGTTAGFPGDWCKYCPAAPYCDAKRAQVGEFLGYDPKNMQQLANAMGVLEQMKAQIKAIEGETFRQLEAGRPVPGWKLVLKQGRRRWIDADAARKKLRHSGVKGMRKELYVEEVMLTAPKVTANLKAAGFEIDMGQFITNASTGTTIAPEKDKRSPVEHANANVPEALDAIIGK